MKKLFTLIICLLFIPVVYAKNDIEIESITLDSKSDEKVEKDKPAFENLDMNYNVSFKRVGDYAKYKVVVKNNTDNDFKINIKDAFGKRDFVTYTYDGAEDLKANDKATIFVTITYAKEVEPGNYIAGIYNDLNKATLELLNDTQTNPETKTGLVVIGVLVGSLLLFIVSTFLFKNNAVRFISIVMLFGVIVVPLFTNALSKYIITINTKVEILKTYKVAYRYYYSTFYTKAEVTENDLESYCGSSTYKFNGHDEEYRECYFEDLYTDPERHFAGEQVFVLKVDREVNDCSGDFYFNNGVYVCDGELVKVDRDHEWGPNYWGYMKSSEWPWAENDAQVMKFIEHGREVYNDWNSEGLISAPVGAEFTMPEHDVYFEELIPS